ncbi:MAG: esterase [Gammaproteobacteria bacterium]|nr:esterase [Gammaproteobacteria bacterium]
MRQKTTGFFVLFVCAVFSGIIFFLDHSDTDVRNQLDGSFVFYESFPSESVSSRPVDIWLPEGYHANTNDRYPVIYMHDGQLLFDKKTSPYAKFWYRPFGWYIGGMFWEVDKTMSLLIREKKIRPAIVVSIWFIPNRRGAEFMPQKPITMVETGLEHIGDSDVTPDDVISDNYLKFVTEELKPFVDKNFRTLTDRDNTFVMGSSMGGSISAYAISEYPDIFGGAACLSTDWTHGKGAEIDWYEQHWPKGGKHRLYFDYGTETHDAPFEPYQNRMDNVLRQHGYIEGEDWVTKKFDGADHSPMAWRERLHIPLTFLLSN